MSTAPTVTVNLSGTPNARQRGLLDDMVDFYNQGQREVPDYISQLYHTTEANGRYEDFHFWRDKPTLRPWEYGDAISAAGFDDMTHRILVNRWGVEVSYEVDDNADNRAPRKHREEAQMIAYDEGSLTDRVSNVLITGTSDAAVMSTVPKCADGRDFFDDDHEEHADGNIVSHSSWNNSPEDLRATMMERVLRRYREMKHPLHNEPLFRPDVIQRARFVCFFDPQHEYLFEEAFSLNQVGSFQFASATPSEGIAGASKDNILQMRFRQKTQLIPYNRFDGFTDKFIVFMLIPGPGAKKPFMQLKRDSLDVLAFNPETDGDARRHDLEGLRVKFRSGYGYGYWPCAILVDGS